MSIGIWQLVLILVIVFVVFGAGKLPRVMGDIGKGVKNLKDGLGGADDKPAPKRITHKAEVKPAAPKAKKTAAKAPVKAAAVKKPSAAKKTTAKKPAAKKVVKKKAPATKKS